MGYILTHAQPFLTYEVSSTHHHFWTHE